MTSSFSHLTSAALTDVGRKRKNNEDSLLSIPEYGVFCVADGMGGTDAGEVASSVAVEHVKRAFSDSAAESSVSAAEKGRVARKALEEANRWIWRHSVEKGLRSCGTTAVVLVFDAEHPRRAQALHAGDSRAYCFRNGELKQLTTDHSFAAATGIKNENLIPARFRSVITRAVGITEEIAFDETPVDVAEHDIFLLCSDGLTRMVPDRNIRRILEEHKGEHPKTMAEVLVREANSAGGLDNISVVIVRIGATPPGEAIEAGPQTVGDAAVTTQSPPPATELTAQAPLAGVESRGVWTRDRSIRLSLAVKAGLIIAALVIFGLALFLLARHRPRTAAQDQDTDLSAMSGETVQTGAVWEEDSETEESGTAEEFDAGGDKSTLSGKKVKKAVKNPHADLD